MHHHLTDMGILIWQQRNKMEPTIKPPRYVIIVGANKDPHGPFAQLLTNILKAIDCPIEETKMLQVEDPKSLAGSSWDNTPMIVFGEAFYPYIPEHAIRTLSLQDLNQNLPAKKALWQRLKS